MTIPTLEKLIKDQKFDWVNSNITSNLFPIPKELRTDYRLFHFDKYISSEDAIKEMNKEGYLPANIYELLSWKYWNDRYWVVALGSAPGVGGFRDVPCLSRRGSKRRLDLGWWGLDWSADCRFLGTKVDSKDTKVLESKHESCKHKINYCPDCGEKIW